MAFAYARGGVRRYWLVDLPGEIVLVLDAHVDGIDTTTVAELLML